MKPISQRIVGGRLRGKKLQRIDGAIRPTADRTREAIFNILGQQVIDARVLDVFAGSGALGLEALSRGARSAVFIDNQPAALKLIGQNIRHCRVQAHARVIRCAIPLQPLPTVDAPFDWIFVDPPYKMGMIGPALRWLMSGGGLHGDSHIVIEHDRSESVADLLANDPALTLFILFDVRRYGKAGVSFLRCAP